MRELKEQKQPKDSKERRRMRWMLLSLIICSASLAAQTPASGPAATTPATTPATTQSASTDTPVAAAKSFALAFMNPTRDRLRAAVTGRTPAEEQASDIWADQLSSQFRLQE